MNTAITARPVRRPQPKDHARLNPGTAAMLMRRAAHITDDPELERIAELIDSNATHLDPPYLVQRAGGARPT